MATAKVTFLYTTVPIEEISGEDKLEKKGFVIKANKNTRILSCRNFYSNPGSSNLYHAVGYQKKSIRDTTFDQSLKKRVSAFSNICNQYNFFGRSYLNNESIEKLIADAMFHDKFHHSEQAIMHFLSSADGINYLVELVNEQCKAKYVYGIVLDI